MSKYNNKSSNNNNDNNTSFSYNVNNQNNDNQDFSQSVNRSLDQTKDNINRSIDESRKQIPRFNDIVNSYQEQNLQAVKEITENYIEYQQNVNTTVNAWNSPEAVVNAYSRFVSNVADNTVTYLRTTNNIIFSNMESMKSVMQHAKDNSKQIFNQNVNAAKTFEQNSKDIVASAQDANTRFNASINSNSGR